MAFCLSLSSTTARRNADLAVRRRAGDEAGDEWQCETQSAIAGNETNCRKACCFYSTIYKMRTHFHAWRARTVALEPWMSKLLSRLSGPGDWS